MNLRTDETVLVGNWKTVNGKVMEDEISVKIKSLVREHLQALAAASGGWERLFRDPADGRLWELTYPMSNTQGGGPPTLKVVSEELARSKYKF